MSLTSLELNYLIWKYLQESGYELAAYALQKNSHCLEYEHGKNRSIASIEPGCLVNLVQKGILYTFVEDTSEGKEDHLSLVNALLKDKANQASQASELQAYQESQPKLQNGTAGTTEGDAEGNAPGKKAEDKTVGESDRDGNPDVEMEDAAQEVDFTTVRLTASLTFAPSVVSSWHPSSGVFAVGREDAKAEIHALGADGNIAETVTLSHPPLVDDAEVQNVISTVSWSPQGSMVLTSGVSGAIRAWTPDGRLKNIVNSVASADRVPATIHSLLWNTSGLLVLSIDVKNTLSVWDGSSLALVLETRGSESYTGELNACWVSDSKFAVSTVKNAIKIYSVSLAPGEKVATVGQLVGHEHPITGIAFSEVSKLLATASDVDYAIKIWNSLLSQDALEVNTVGDKDPSLHYHTTPIIGLHWLARAGDMQGNELVSVSMEGTVNIWDAFTGDAFVSANIFKNADNFRFQEEQAPDAEAANTLVFATALLPDSAYLAIGDDSGSVSIWDVQVARYRGTKDLLRCLAMFSGERKDDAGICDLAWDNTGRYLSVCYKGLDSVMLKWSPEQVPA